MPLKDFLVLVWRYLRHKKKPVIGAIFLSIAGAFLMAMAPKILGWLIDQAISAQSSHEPTLLLVGFLWLIIQLVGLYVMRIVKYRGAVLGEYVFKEFMAELCEHYMCLPMAFHKKEKSGEIISRFERAGNHLLDIVEYLLFNLLPSMITALVVLALMFKINQGITLALLLVLILYVTVTVKKTRKIVRARDIVNKTYERFSGTIHDIAKNIQLVKACASEQTAQTRLNERLEQNYRRSNIFYRQFRSLRCWQDNIQGGGLILLLALAVILLFDKQITAGIFVVLFSYIRMAFRPFSQLANTYRFLQEAMTTIGRAVKIWDEPIEKYNGGKKIVLRGAVEYRQVRFSYENGQPHILQKISFSVKPGQIIGVVGESGAGKTTLLSLLVRFYEPDEGKILIDGHDVKSLDLTFLRRQIAIVPQEVSLFNDTLWNNLTYALPGKVSKEQVVRVLKSVNAWDFVQKMPNRLNQLVGERGMKLSTGQKQRIAIARALLGGQRIIILDEATSAQDSKSEEFIQRELFNLPGRPTIFIIAHRLSTIVGADKILVVDNAGLPEQGTHEELMNKNGIYADLVRRQLENK